MAEPRAPRERDEFAVLDGFVRVAAAPGARSDAVLLGPGDDAAVIQPGGPVLTSTDLLVEGRHFRSRWSTPEQIGARAIAQNAADIAAMGGQARWFLLGLGVPAGLAEDVLTGLQRGAVDAAADIGAVVVGGDLVVAPALTLAVTVLGTAPGPIVTRAGAQVGDLVVLAGTLGRSAAGLALLDAGLREPAELLARYRVPTPPLAAGPALAAAGAHAMADVSDGLLADLGHLAAASNVVIDVHPASLPDDALLSTAATALGDVSLARAWTLTGGEDHALVATLPASAVLPAGVRAIGTVVARAENPGASLAPQEQQVLVDGVVWTAARGWDSLGGTDTQGGAR